MVMGYRDPECLALAMPVYLAAGIEVFVHVDAKLPLEEYKARIGPHAVACHFIEQRFDIFWGGFNMVRAEVSLLRAAYGAARDYTNFALISDDSFPLLPPSTLAAFLQNDRERISIRRIDETDPFWARYHNLFYFDHPATSLHGRPIESAFVDGRLFAAIDDMKHLRSTGKSRIEVFYGSQWWSLSRDTAGLVLRIFEDDVRLRKSFEYSAVPDEMYIQSIVGNNVPERVSCLSPMLVDWAREPRPFVFTSAEQAADQVRPHHAFLRKVTSGARDFLLTMQGRLLA